MIILSIVAWINGQLYLMISQYEKTYFRKTFPKFYYQVFVFCKIFTSFCALFILIFRENFAFKNAKKILFLSCVSFSLFVKYHTALVFAWKMLQFAKFLLYLTLTFPKVLKFSLKFCALPSVTGRYNQILICDGFLWLINVRFLRHIPL